MVEEIVSKRYKCGVCGQCFEAEESAERCEKQRPHPKYMGFDWTLGSIFEAIGKNDRSVHVFMVVSFEVKKHEIYPIVANLRTGVPHSLTEFEDKFANPKMVTNPLTFMDMAKQMVEHNRDQYNILMGK